MNKKSKYIILLVCFFIGLLIIPSRLLPSGGSKNKGEQKMIAAEPENREKGREKPEKIIFTEDNRSDQLRSLTMSWNTNWNRRSIEYSELLHGGPPRDGIPSIYQPQFESVQESSGWLKENEPVILIELNGDARSYPIQILIWHEIVNDVVGGIPIIVTFCPLCNAAIVFDRRINGDVYEFGTSGLLRNSDLVMYDRKTESLWQQLTGEAIVGDHTGDSLVFLPGRIVSFNDFKLTYPDGKVLSRKTGFRRDYGRNPYVGYDSIDQSPFLFTGETDDRLKPMERVVAVSLETQSDESFDVAYPFTLLTEKRVINDTISGTPIVVFHINGTSSALDRAAIADGKDIGSSGVFSPIVKGQKYQFEKKGNNIVDKKTKSVWNIFGHAIKGPLKGESLRAIPHADHFWFAWAAFKPDTIIYNEP
jgi:hypothetical protein